MALGFGYKFGFSRAGGLDPATVSFKQRVEADGGTVEDVNFLNSFITNAKNNNYYDDIVAAYSPSWGVKGTTTASKLYCIKSASTDLAQGTAASQPDINLADLNGRTRLFNDGIDDFIGPIIFTYNQPATKIYMGYETELWSSNRTISDGGAAVTNLVRYSTLSPAPALNLFAGLTDVENSDAAVVTPAHLRVLFNGASSSIQVDNNAEVTGNPGANNPGGFTLGARANGANSGEFSVGAIVLLDAAVDGSYQAKIDAIRNFSKSAYGTP
jgi:hypothetical protein